MKRTLLLPALALLAGSALAQQTVVAPAYPSVIVASGNAQIKTSPDMATIRVGVETQAKTAKEAQAGTSALANRLIEAALRVAPDRKAYQTSDLSLEPVYVQPGQGGLGTGEPPKLVGYRARNVLTVRLDDVSKVGPLVDAVTGAGATNVDSIAFGLKDDKAARRQALIAAVREAREKAEAMAEGLGLKLAGVQGVDEGGGTIVRPYMARTMAMADASTPVMAGEVTTDASVTVRFFFSQTSIATGQGR